jgi:hypothetical protein
VAAVEELGEKLGAAGFERFAEGEVFEPAVGTGDEIKVGWGGPHPWRKRRRMSGVVRARSAAARRVTGEIASR